MSSIAYLFPGQGSQSAGMGKAIAENHAGAREIFGRADAILGYPLSKLCFEGPEEELKQTENTQPALYVVSAATLAVLCESGIAPAAVTGHSLGEYTALYAAGVFDFETGLKLVRTRGLAFADAGKARPGAMAAIIGLEGERVAEMCAEASGDGSVVVPANYNDPAQTVISGDPPAVTRACELCKSAGAKRALPLPVSGAFHSPLVAPAADAMRKALDGVELHPPRCAFINNVDANVLDDPAAIRESLINQVTSSVRWVGCVERIASLGITNCIEVGSGKVLAGLARRVNKDLNVKTTESWEATQSAISS
ncbi:ACP S-malonyltransferase [Candidatus Poribacteria bacterium]|nr:ACP S-malonyltransferase [Candidatus Poribacteria bacterium]